MNDDFKRAVQRRGSFVQTAKAVAWSFFGVRKSADYEHDINHLNPLHVVIAGVCGALMFIFILIGLVRWVIGSGIAA